MTTSNESGQWTTQGDDDGGNNGGGDVVALAVTSAGIGRCNESGRGVEEDVVFLLMDGTTQKLHTIDTVQAALQ